MAGGVVVPSSAPHYEGKTTLYVIWLCLVAATGGLIFGYDIGISGGVTSMNSFLTKFFPEILGHNDKNTYCRYDNQKLQLFTSSLYLAGLISTFFAMHTTSRWGRRPSMLIGGSSFLLGAALNAGAQNLAMLIIGRILLGIGVGFANQSVPLYLSEMAPSKLRGAMNIMFQLATTIGILTANIINYLTHKKDDGWRVSLGLAGVPALVLSFGSFFLPETPNNLIERGRYEEGRRILQKLRGIRNVEVEYDHIVLASQKAQSIHNPLKNLLKRQNRPELSVAILVPFFQQVTGINAIQFYAPVLFQTLGFKGDVSMISAVITGAVFLIATFGSVFTVDCWGRKVLFLEGGLQMLICQIFIGVVLKYKLALPIGSEMPHTWAMLVVVFICIYVAGFAWSWGPLGWLVPSEVFPLEIRSAAQSLTVSVNFLFTFIIGQAFLTMLCNLRWGIFLLFGAWVAVMTFYTMFFLPETKSIPIEEMKNVWASHWFWKNFVGDKDTLNKEMTTIYV